MLLPRSFGRLLTCVAMHHTRNVPQEQDRSPPRPRSSSSPQGSAVKARLRPPPARRCAFPAHYLQSSHTQCTCHIAVLRCVGVLGEPPPILPNGPSAHRHPAPRARRRAICRVHIIVLTCFWMLVPEPRRWFVRSPHPAQRSIPAPSPSTARTSPRRAPIAQHLVDVLPDRSTGAASLDAAQICTRPSTVARPIPAPAPAPRARRRAVNPLHSILLTCLRSVVPEPRPSTQLRLARDVYGRMAHPHTGTRTARTSLRVPSHAYMSLAALCSFCHVLTSSWCGMVTVLCCTLPQTLVTCARHAYCKSLHEHIFHCLCTVRHCGQQQVSCCDQLHSVCSCLPKTLTRSHVIAGRRSNTS